MKSYDLRTQTFNSALPYSMDVFMEGYRKMQLLADDKYALEALAKSQGWRHRHHFVNQVLIQGQTVLVTTLKQEIVFASSSLADLSGYQPEEVLGYTPAIFQGKLTQHADKITIRRSVANATAFEVIVYNYRKNGSMYKCYIKGFPMFNRNKELVNYIAIEKELDLAA